MSMEFVIDLGNSYLSSLSFSALLAMRTAKTNHAAFWKQKGDHMLPTPSTGHVPFERVYEPAEDSFLFLDTLSSQAEKEFLQSRYSLPIQRDSTSKGTSALGPSPLIAEIGTGSGVILAFVNAHAKTIFGRSDILTIGMDVNVHACKATEKTVMIAALEQSQQGQSHGLFLGNVTGDLTTPLRYGLVDLLIFNPPYVPTSDLPILSCGESISKVNHLSSYENDLQLLSLSYAGGLDGMEITYRLLEMLPATLSLNGVAYVLLSSQNKPEIVKEHIRGWASGWAAETIGRSGKTAGWEKLQIIRIWRKPIVYES